MSLLAVLAPNLLSFSSSFQPRAGVRAISPAASRPAFLAVQDGMFPLRPDATLEQCLDVAPQLCSAIKAGEFSDADLHLGPLALFISGSNGLRCVEQLEAADSPLGKLLREEARDLRFAGLPFPVLCS